MSAERIRKRRTVARASVTKFINKIELELSKTAVNNDDLEEFVEHLTQKAEELNLIDSEFEQVIDDESLETELISAEEYREKIITWKFRALKRIQMSKQDSVDVSVVSHNSKLDEAEVEGNKQMNLRLPKLTIDKFFGDVSQFLTFWNSFDSSIHKNESLSKVEKFNYLKAYLGGTALSTVEGFAITPENYDIAINLLKERFGRKDLLINAHLNNLLNIHPLRNSNDVKIFRGLFDYVQTQVRSLESLGIKTDAYGNLLCPILLKALPNDLILEFNKKVANSNCTAEELLNFLYQQLSVRERTFVHSLEFKERKQSVPCHPTFSPRNTKWSEPGRKTQSRSPYVTASDLACVVGKEGEVEERNRNKCFFCGKSHETAECDNAFTLSTDEKKSILSKSGACFKCVKRGHLSRFCRAKLKCSICGKSHLKIMCYKYNDVNVNDERIKKYRESADNSVLTNSSFSNEVFLQTLIVCINANDMSKFIRIIIDTGSQRSYISKFVVEKMHLKCVGRKKVVHGLFGGIERKEEHKLYTVNLSSIDNQYTCDVEVMDQDKICSFIPRLNRNSVCFNELKDHGIFVTDISMNENCCLFEKSPDEIHMLIGADFAGTLFTGEIKYLSGGITVLNTHLGWTLMGSEKEESAKDKNLAMTVTSLFVQESEVADLWRLDLIGIKDPIEKMSKAEQDCKTKEDFLETVTFRKDGHYEVHLPWSDESVPLPDNFTLAKKRLETTTTKLMNMNLYQEYEKVLLGWFDEGIIEEVPESEKETYGNYLPHRPVIKENSKTTPIRPVFDASAKMHNHPSLNQCLQRGPNLIELIPDILLRFREGRFGITADIRKAFLQIGICEEDRNFLRFLWWKNLDKRTYRVFRHTRVVFGVNCSPFILASIIEHHIEKSEDFSLEFRKKLMKSFYVDNVVTSVDEKEDVSRFISGSVELMSKGGFDLREWEFSPENWEEEAKTEIPVLGLLWNNRHDTLSINMNWLKGINLEKVTKRNMLSVAHRIFDPIGYAAPVILRPKLMIQQTWKEGLSWDAEVTGNLLKEFVQWFEELGALETLHINRWIGVTTENLDNCTIHTFCDASKEAYAAVVFLRVVTGGRIEVFLLSAKARVAPLKGGTIPRMELLAALVGARLTNSVLEGLSCKNVKRFYWSDSTTVIAWICRNENWSVFVRNRVNEIRKLSNPSEWHYVSGEMNPADLPSRGCGAKQLVSLKWWEGPQWLRKQKEQWPTFEIISPDMEIVNSERLKTIVSATNSEQDGIFPFTRFSSYTKILRIMAWIYRFCHNVRTKDEKKQGELKAEEIIGAEKIILKKVQEEGLKGNQTSLKRMQTFLDSDGILRLKSRISMRKDFENLIYPIILPSKHDIVTKLILCKHSELCHAGLHVMMSSLRENYWILKSRKTIRRVLNQCVKCKRFTARPIEILSAPLPEDRVRDAHVFEVIGVDLCGPLYLKKDTKCWIVLFTCAVYRSVHLELVTSLSTDNFILAFRRFIARRGRPTTVYSDNGKNLIGTANELKRVDWKRLKEFASLNKINWKLNPPAAPWWGGFWERLIGLLKSLLRRVLGRASLQCEELWTILCDVESVINSRPLTYLSEDPHDLIALTPAMFLQEIKEVGVPDLDYIDSKKMKKRFYYRQRLRHDLRKRFRTEYLGQLRELNKSLKEYGFKEGDVVLVGDDKSRRMDWPLGRILKVFPGKDGKVRVAKVKTAGGLIIRPAKKLYPLEVQEMERTSLMDRQNPSGPGKPDSSN